MQTDIRIYSHHRILDAPRTVEYFQILGVRRGLSWAFVDVAEEMLELTDGTRYDAGDIWAIEDDLRAVSEQVEADLAAGAWDHLPADMARAVRGSGAL